MSKSFHLFKNCRFASHFSNPSLDCFIHFKGDNNYAGTLFYKITLWSSMNLCVWGTSWSSCMFATNIHWLFSCWRCPFQKGYLSDNPCQIDDLYGVWVRQLNVHPSICSLLHSCSLCRHVMFNLWWGALHGSTTNGCVADWLSIQMHFEDFCWRWTIYSSLCENGHGVMWNDESQASSIF